MFYPGVLPYTASLDILLYLELEKSTLVSSGGCVCTSIGGTLNKIQIQIQIIFLHYTVLHGQTKFDPSYAKVILVGIARTTLSDCRVKYSH